MIIAIAAALLATPAWTPPARFTSKSGVVVDCTALRAAKSGDVLGMISRAGLPPQAMFRALETCFAEGPHACDAAWVGHAIFGGLSMAVVDGAAAPFAERKARFAEVCRALTPAEQACVRLSSHRVTAKGPEVSKVCAAARRTLNAQLGEHRGAAQLKRRIRAPKPKTP